MSYIARIEGENKFKLNGKGILISCKDFNAKDGYEEAACEGCIEECWFSTAGKFAQVIIRGGLLHHPRTGKTEKLKDGDRIFMFDGKFEKHRTLLG